MPPFAPPPPFPPSCPPSPCRPPATPGAAYQNVLSFAVVLEGQIYDFDADAATLGFTSLLSDIGVTAAQVSLTPEAASVKVTVDVVVPGKAAASASDAAAEYTLEAVATLLSSGTGLASLGSALGMPVERVAKQPALRVAAVFASPPSPPLPTLDDPSAALSVGDNV